MVVKSTVIEDPKTPPDRSEALLIAACRMIARHGARKLSLRDVAAEAGVSKALIHYYFSSRNDLLARAYEFSDERGRERISAEVAGVESGAVRLSRLLDLYLTDDPTVDEDWILWSELSSTAMFQSELRPVMEASFARWTGWIDRLVRDAIDEGSIAPGTDPDDASLEMVALTDGLGSLLTRGLVSRDHARRVLTRHLDAVLGRANGQASPGGARTEAPATGYLRMLATLTHTAVEELQGLASTARERQAIAVVSGLIESRATQGATGPAIYPIGQADARPRANGVRGTPIGALETPAVIVDLDRCERNLRSFADAVAARGVAFRPHAKTHKSPAVAARQLGLGAVGLAVAKTGEAEIFWQAGCRDIVIAYPVIGSDKWDRIARMAGEGHIAVNVDSEFGARGLSQAAAAAGATVGVQLEIDTGLRRSGLPPDQDAEIERLARLCGELPGLAFEGLTTYRGLASSSGVGREQAGAEEAELIVSLARSLRERGIAVDTVVAGSTSTTGAVAAVEGITEVRAGAYAFMDGAQLQAGTASAEDVALLVLCTVVSVSPDGRVTVDGGSKTFSANGPAIDGAYAISTDGRVRLDKLTEEHGIGRLKAGAPPVSVGDRLTFVPSYASSVVGLADELVALRDGVVDEKWPVVARGATG